MPGHLLLVLYAPISSFRQRLRIRIRTPIRVLWGMDGIGKVREEGLLLWHFVKTEIK